MPIILLLILLFGQSSSSAETIVPDVLMPGQLGTFQWEIKSDKATEIQRITTSCACSLPKGLQPFLLQPNESKIIPLQYWHPTPGDFSVRASAWSNDPHLPFQVMSFGYRVRDLVTPAGEPAGNPWARLDLEYISDKNSWSGRRILLRGPHPKEWASIACNIPNGELPNWSANVTHDGDRWIVDVGLDPRGLCGVWATKLQFHFKANDGEEISYTPRLPLRAIIPGKVEAQPRTVIIGAITTGSNTDASVTIKADPAWGAHPVSISQEENDREGTRGITASLIFSQNKSTESKGIWNATITLSVPNNAPPGKANGAVAVAFSDGTKLRIPYLVTVIPNLPSP